MTREDSMPLIQVTIAVRISRDALRQLPGRTIERVRDAAVQALIAPAHRLQSESEAETVRQLRLLRPRHGRDRLRWRDTSLAGQHRQLDGVRGVP
jgi:hypothetical protein